MTPPNKTQQALPDGAERAFAAHAPPLASKEPSPPRPTVHLLNCMLLRVVRITSGVRSSGGLRSCDLEKFASLVTCRLCPCHLWSAPVSLSLPPYLVRSALIISLDLHFRK